MKYKLKLDYTEEELRELKELGAGTHSVENLQAKYLEMRHEDEFDFMADINNVVMGTSIFPEKKYVVHDKATDRYVCFNRLEESFYWSQLWIPEKKTKDEWLAINPAYETMLERVED